MKLVFEYENKYIVVNKILKSYHITSEEYYFASFNFTYKKLDDKKSFTVICDALDVLGYENIT